MITLRRFSNLWNGGQFAVAWFEQFIVFNEIPPE